MRNDSLEDLERALAQALTKVRELAAQNALPPVLQPLTNIAPPRGFNVLVQLRPYTEHAQENERDLRWDARDGELVIGYELAQEEPSRDERGHYGDDLRGPPAAAPPDPQVALRDVIRVVGRAESDPTFKFLALKFLRDQLLPRQVAWAVIPHESQIQINQAIDQGVLLTSKVENPRQPQYPVTAVQLNREHPLVRELLGSNGAPAAAPARTEPSEMDGEPT